MFLPTRPSHPAARNPPWQFLSINNTIRRTLASCAGRNDLMRHRIGKTLHSFSVGDDRVKLPASTVCGVVPWFGQTSLALGAHLYRFLL